MPKECRLVGYTSTKEVRTRWNVYTDSDLVKAKELLSIRVAEGRTFWLDGENDQPILISGQVAQASVWVWETWIPEYYG